MSIDILTVCYTVYAPNVYISHLDWNKRACGQSNQGRYWKQEHLENYYEWSYKSL